MICQASQSMTFWHKLPVSGTIFPMSAILDIAVLLAFLGGGAIAAKLKFAPSGKIVDSIIRWVLWILLFSMGLRIGNNPALYANMKTMGAMALATAILTVLGSAVAVLLASLVIPSLKKEPAKGKTTSQSKFFAHLRTPLYLLAIVIAGFIAGILLPVVRFDLGIITGWTLNALLFFIGMQFAMSGISLKEVIATPAALVVPLATIVGTFGGSLVLTVLFPISAGKALALGGGFGWYSLSGVLISNLGDPVLGSTSFLANMFRESLALILIPFLGRSRVPSLAVSVGGATAMDVTLPLIEQSAGPWIVPLSFMSGAILSLIVPFLVPLFFRLG